MFEKFVALLGLILVVWTIILSGVPIHIVLLLVSMLLFCTLSLLVGIMYG